MEHLVSIPKELLYTMRTGRLAGSNALEVLGPHLVQCENWWTEAEEHQAYCRLYRQKQLRTVHVWMSSSKTLN